MSARHPTDGSWENVLRGARPCDHVIQVYQDDTFLSRAVSQFIAPALAQGDAGIVIATSAHTELFRDALSALGVDVDAAVASDQLLLVDAASCLATFMRDDRPDPRLFSATVGSMLARVRGAGYEPTRLYGEMVDLLWRGNLPATLELEEMWNGALQREGARLLCGYRLDNFDPDVHRGVLHQITRAHSHLIPIDDYDRLDEAVARAYAETFGSGEDSATLRRLMASASPCDTVMPEAEAALFALSRLTPLIADEVLDRARRHYATTL